MAAIPGISEDGMSIIDPVQYTESVIKRSLPGLWRVQSNPPTFETLIATGMLSQDTPNNKKTYQPLVKIPGFTRISASGKNNYCWFESFLTCMSPAYRTLRLTTREQIVSGFRTWCSKHTEKIVEQIPDFLRKFDPSTDDEFREDVKNVNKEINVRTGFIIAWYFGVNIIYVKLEETGPVIDTTAPYQSPDCKTIFMVQSGLGHYEPLGVLGLTTDNKYDETTSTFVFNWTDERICALPNRPATWKLPVCPITNSRPANKPPTNTIVDSNYFDWQSGDLSCGRRALNNLIRREKFVKTGGVKLNDLTVDPKLKPADQINLQHICNLYQTELTKLNPYASQDLCQEAENYDINVLTAALNIVGFNVDRVNLNTNQNSADTYGLLINLGGGHWVSAIRNPDGYMYYDSMSSNKKPVYIQTLYNDIKTTKKIFGSETKGVYRVTNVGRFIDPIIGLKKSINAAKQEVTASNTFGSAKQDLIKTINNMQSLNQDSKEFLINRFVTNIDNINAISDFKQILNGLTDDIILQTKINVQNETKNIGAKIFNRLQARMEGGRLQRRHKRTQKKTKRRAGRKSTRRH